MGEQGSCRIPLSIKVDRDEMYKNFISPARAENKLNTLVVELLRAYYEVDSVRECVDNRMLKTDELRAMQSQIDKMVTEHIKAMAQTRALQFETEQAANGVAMDDDVVIEDLNGSIDKAGVSNEVAVKLLGVMEKLSERLDKLEANVGVNVGGVKTKTASGGTMATKTFEKPSKIDSNGGGSEITLPKTNAQNNANFGASETAVKNETGVSENGVAVSAAPAPAPAPVAESVLVSTDVNSAPVPKRRRAVSFSRVCAGLEKTED